MMCISSEPSIMCPSSTLSTAPAGPNPHSHQNNFIYCRGRSLLMICSFIPIIFNNHVHWFIKLVHLLSFSPYTIPEKWAYHLPSSSTPNYPGKITFFPSPHFRPLPYIPHEKWGYHHLWTSTQNFPGNIGFWKAFQGDLSDYKWRRMDDNYTAVLLMKTQLKI